MADALGWLSRWTRGPTLEERWVVVDVESSGLDPSRDRLIAIGAVALTGGRVIPADSLEVTLRQPTPSSVGNILVHGVGVAAQSSGAEPREALEHFIRFTGQAPVLAFHAPFDRKLIERTAQEHLGRSLNARWLDLAELAPALFPGTRLKSLDEWLAHLKIPNQDRHSAAGDAFATAILAARLIEDLARKQAVRWGDLQKLARNARWIQ